MSLFHIDLCGCRRSHQANTPIHNLFGLTSTASVSRKLNMKEMSVLLDRIDGLIMEILKDSKSPLSAYMIAKEAKISWSTANTHCYKLKSLGIIEDRIIETEIGQRKTYWKLKAKTPSLNTYMK
ncbi:MAG: HTH domain-containing protein [Candidatus Altiarchaeota archaeon]|nr:HTH domain-containing protein [Candidatus Altiarchaeota archaeon]